jgi:hypothetical protein
MRRLLVMALGFAVSGLLTPISNTGDYGAIYRFIHRLEMTERYLVIEQLDATRLDTSDRASRTLLVFNVKVATFLRPSLPGVQES